MEKIRAYKGHVVFTPELGKFSINEDSYIVVDGKRVKGVFKELPVEYREVDVVDYEDKLIIPGFVDLHLHASQYANVGLGVDEELLDWLDIYTFPEEAKYEDLDFAKEAYGRFVHDLWKVGTTRSVIFATIHRESTMLLMDMIDKAGLGAFVGKLNMNRNSPDFYIESKDESLEETEKFIKETRNKYEKVKPIITPRFVPSCSLELMNGLGQLAEKYQVPIQSHLSENRKEVELVKELFPQFDSYSAVYEETGLFRDSNSTVMAHCVWSTKEEMEIMKRNDVIVAHSPHSNANVSSGIAPISEFISRGISVGLASDVSGGHRLAITDAMTLAAQMSNLRWVHIDDKYDPLTLPELFFLATKGGGKFFGKVGSFEEGYEFDALVIDDSSLKDINQRSIEERIQKYIYLGDDRNILDRYVAGEKIEEPNFN